MGGGLGAAEKDEGKQDRRWSPARRVVLTIGLTILVIGIRVAKFRLSLGLYPAAVAVPMLLAALFWEHLVGRASAAPRSEQEREEEASIYVFIVMGVLACLVLGVLLVLYGRWISLLVLSGLAAFATLLVWRLAHPRVRARGLPAARHRPAPRDPDP